ncbi:sigma-70 family RNA polymerase sigma factor [Colwelliaceae bacterium BS250]
MLVFATNNSAPALICNQKHITTKVMNNIDHQQLAHWLVAVAETRDQQAFTQLFKFFAPKIQRIAAGKFNTQAIANEVVQETMTNVWRKAHMYHVEKGAPTTWVYTVMRNVTFDMLRKIKSKKEDTFSDDIWPMLEQVDEESNEFADHIESKKILSYLDKLPENQQQVIKGFYLQEMSQEQLANHLNLPLGTVKSRLRLALTKLKQQVNLQLGE